MKIGTIDIGTNSMRLLTAQYKDGKIIDRKKYVNKSQERKNSLGFNSFK